MSWFKRNIANFITLIRIAGAIALIFLVFPHVSFLIVYGICGFSDVVDGFVARKLHIESKLGTVLDSISDITFYIVLGFKILPTMLRLLSIWHWGFIASAFVMHMVAYIICAFKFNKFSTLHTYMNKAMSATIFLFPFSLLGEIYLLYTIYAAIGCVIANLGAIEMILIHSISKNYDERNKTIFLVKRNQNNPSIEQS